MIFHTSIGCIVQRIIPASTSYQYIIPLLDDYVKNSKGKITVDYVDPVEQPAIISTLDPANSFDLASNSGNFVIEYNGNLKIISPVDCYSFDETYYYQTGDYLVNGNNTEFTFTNSMYALTRGFSKKAYIITGLKEEGNIYLTRILEAMAIEVDTIEASDNFFIPDDCDLLILNGPNVDISEKIYVAMTDYMKNGGKLIVAVNYSYLNVNENYTRLNGLLNQMNINIDPLLIYETNPLNQLSSSPYNSMVQPYDYFAEYGNDPAFTISYARSVRAGDNPNSGIQTLPVLYTSDEAKAIEVDEYGNAEVGGTYSIGTYYAAMYSSMGGNNPGEAFVFGTLNFTSDAYISSNGGMNDSNVDFLRGCIRDLTNSTGDDQLSIATKSVDNFSLDSSKATTSNSTLVLVIFMMVIPIALVALAVIVYMKRKNL